MKILNKIIESVAPTWGAKRLQSTMLIKAAYEAAKPSRLHKTRTDRGSADAVNQPAIEALRIQARHLDENFDVASNALDILVDNVVGLGIMPDPQVRDKSGKPHKEFNLLLRNLHKEWAHNAYVNDDYDYYQGQRLEARALFRDGEILKQHVMGNVPSLDHKTKVKYSIELIEADHLPMDFNDEGRKITQGVQKNDWGQVRGYHIYKDHPGSSKSLSYKYITKYVSYENMTHLKMVKRIGQTRGVTVFAPVLNRFDDIKDICESERVAARVAAAFTFYIKKGTPDLYMPSTSGIEIDEREIEMSPGMGLDNLKPGEEYGTIDSNRPNNAIIPFISYNQRMAAGGVGVSYSSLGKDYDNGSWSAKRQEANEQYIHYGTLWSYFVCKSVRIDWINFVKMARFEIKVPSDVDLSTLYSANFSRPPLVTIDEVKEMSAIDKKLKMQLTTKAKELRKYGENPDDMRNTIAQEISDDESAGLPKLESRFGKPADMNKDTVEMKDGKK